MSDGIEWGIEPGCSAPTSNSSMSVKADDVSVTDDDLYNKLMSLAANADSDSDDSDDEEDIPVSLRRCVEQFKSKYISCYRMECKKDPPPIKHKIKKKKEKKKKKKKTKVKVKVKVKTRNTNKRKRKTNQSDTGVKKKAIH